MGLGWIECFFYCGYWLLSCYLVMKLDLGDGFGMD